MVCPEEVKHVIKERINAYYFLEKVGYSNNNNRKKDAPESKRL
jgi:hypothetical protein